MIQDSETPTQQAELIRFGTFGGKGCRIATICDFANSCCIPGPPASKSTDRTCRVQTNARHRKHFMTSPAGQPWKSCGHSPAHGQACHTHRHSQSSSRACLGHRFWQHCLRDNQVAIFNQLAFLNHSESARLNPALALQKAFPFPT